MHLHSSHELLVFSEYMNHQVATYWEVAEPGTSEENIQATSFYHFYCSQSMTRPSHTKISSRLGLNLSHSNQEEFNFGTTVLIFGESTLPTIVTFFYQFRNCKSVKSIWTFTKTNVHMYHLSDDRKTGRKTLSAITLYRLQEMRTENILNITL